MIRIKGGGEPIARSSAKGRKNIVDDYYRSPHALTKTVTPALHGDKPVTKSPKRRVTKRAKVRPRNTPEKGGDRRTGKVKAPSPPPAQEAKVGRPKTHATAADRQRAYRQRQKQEK